MDVTVEKKATLLPEAVGNLIESVNTMSRIVLKTTQGVERVVDGVDEIATRTLSLQSKKLLAELEKAE